MNPDHFHLEFYEDDNGTMPVLTWLNRLESDDMAKHDAIVYGLQVILAREGAGVCGTEFGRTLGKGLYEFRLRHTRDELQIKAESQQAGSGPSVQPVKVLIRVFFAVYGDRIVLLLGGTTRPWTTLATVRTGRSNKRGAGCGLTSSNRNPN